MFGVKISLQCGHSKYPAFISSIAVADNPTIATPTENIINIIREIVGKSMNEAIVMRAQTAIIVITPVIIDNVNLRVT